ncbi:hypothetical protein [Rhizobium sp. 18065]|uniref:hypothetical protein n=1 Tax=Rhizobium sp. 18065 TaxID=2681411 RepID=UPI00135B00F9|nr:hypothetical protein [Rhizobium sp. 18065]
MDTVKNCGRCSCGYSGCFDCFPAPKPKETELEEGPWLIKKRGLYYRPNGSGYTNKLEEAGRFVSEYAHDVLNTCAPGEIVIFPEDSAAFRELVHANNMASGNRQDGFKIASDGGSSGYYVLPPEATELRHLIQARKMNFSIGNIFKACWRLGLKAGTEKYYDLRKMVFFVLDEYEADGREVYKAELNKLKDHINKELARVG